MNPFRKIIYISFTALAPLAATVYASGNSIDASKCLETKMQVSQEIGNVFSRTISFNVDGFDPFVRRVSGTGIYKVETVTPEQIVMSSSFLYDGNPASSGETTVKNGGRTTCWKGDCSISTDASGVSINPLLWGAPTGKLHVGQTWEVAIGVPWELGPAGKQTVRVVSIDPSNDSITLEREGEGEGDALNEIKTLPLIKDKKTYTVQVKAARAKWSGYATFRRGVILSDVLFVERPVTVTCQDLGQKSGTERQYILLNSAPSGSLRSEANHTPNFHRIDVPRSAGCPGESDASVELIPIESGQDSAELGVLAGDVREVLLGAPGLAVTAVEPRADQEGLFGAGAFWNGLGAFEETLANVGGALGLGGLFCARGGS